MIQQFPFSQPCWPPVKFDVLEGRRRFTPEDDNQRLCWLAGQMDGNIVEIGANAGVTTSRLAKSFPEKLVYAVEPPAGVVLPFASQQKELPPEPFKWVKHLTNVRCLAMFSEELDYSTLENVKMVFIDGNHSYQGVKADTEKALPHLNKSKDSILVWHDFTPGHGPWRGVGDYITAELGERLHIWYFPHSSLAFTIFKA